jgi:hypothetical protein
MLRSLGASLALLLACRGTAPRAQGEDIARLVDSLRPAVERATALQFRGPTRSALKSREEIREYLVSRLREDFPPEREEGIRAVYRLLGLIPDTLDLKALLLELYTEQVAGFYDPTTSTLYGVRGADPAQLRLVLAHELVHALQHQYLPLDSIMKSKGEADQQAAAQAVFEGHATLASIRVLLPGQDIVARPEFWSTFREQIKTQQSSMQVFARAPLALREELIFPYLNGAEFMRWWDSARTGQPLPTLTTLPRSTEQILHPARYAAGDLPIPVRFADSSADVLFEDTLGELEIQVLATVLRGGGEVLTDAPVGWGGDRFRIYRSAAGPALVWYTDWDDAKSAERFVGGVGARLLARERAGYRTSAERVAGESHPMVRVVIAPAGWRRWQQVPTIR